MLETENYNNSKKLLLHLADQRGYIKAQLSMHKIQIDLANYSAVIDCSSNTDIPSSTTFFTISSRGNCGSGAESADRTIEISSFISEGV